jgi:hypothetical protein
MRLFMARAFSIAVAFAVVVAAVAVAAVGGSHRGVVICIGDALVCNNGAESDDGDGGGGGGGGDVPTISGSSIASKPKTIAVPVVSLNKAGG